MLSTVLGHVARFFFFSFSIPTYFVVVVVVTVGSLLFSRTENWFSLRLYDRIKYVFIFHQVINKSDRPAAFDMPLFRPISHTHILAHRQCKSICTRNSYPNIVREEEKKNSLPVFMWSTKNQERKECENATSVRVCQNWFFIIGTDFVHQWSDIRFTLPCDGEQYLCIQYHLL